MSAKIIAYISPQGVVLLNKGNTPVKYTPKQKK